MQNGVMDFTGTRVLLVEDEGLVAINAERMLTSIGCSLVGFAARVPHALEKLGLLDFDVAMLDINLGGTMGYRVAETLMTRNIPFFFATGYDRTSLPQELRSVPLVTKPYTVAQLSRTLRSALNREKMTLEQ